jgi:5,10-methylenetetrahydromethanopterin reductase
LNQSKNIVRAQFDIGILPQEPVADFVDLVAAAEDKGFGGVWVADSQSIFRDAYAALAVCALRTRKMLLATGVTNPITRHPAVIAGGIATIDELSGGRAILGIGTGFSAVRTLGLKPAPLKVMEEAVLCMRSLLQRQTAVYEGREIKMTWPVRQVPIYFASSGPKSLQLAGRIADGVVFQIGSDPALIRYAIGQVLEGARQAGRTRSQIQLCARLGCALSGNRDEARNEIRAYAAAAAETVFQSNAEDTLPAEVVADLKKLKEHYDYYQHVNHEADHLSLVTDRVIDSMVIAGTPAEVLPRFQAILQLGVDRVVIPLTVRNRMKMLKTLADEVIAYLT